MSDRVQALIGSLFVAGIACASYVAYDAYHLVEQQQYEIQQLSDHVHSLTEKLLADQESNLKDLEANRLLEKKVEELEIVVNAQRGALEEINNKLSRKKK